MSNTDQQTYEMVIQTIKKFSPKFQVKAKKYSWHQKFAGKVLSLFGNKSYMDSYYTTVGSTVYYPGEELDYGSWPTMTHEGGHTLQRKKYTLLLFGLLYFLGTPLYLLPALLGSWPFFIWLPWWSGLIFIGAFALLCIPVPFGMFRTKFELDMYILSVAVNHWRGQKIDDAYLEWAIKQFTTGAYFWMCPFPKYIKRKLKGGLEKAKSGKVFEDGNYGEYYQSIYRTMKRSGVVKQPPQVEPKD